MHVPRAFSVSDPLALLHDLVADHAVTLITGVDGDLRANIVAVLLERDGSGPGRLIGHVARTNVDIVDADDTEVLVVAQGAAGYISPGWYASKAEHGRVVPTWDYEVVEAHGRLHLLSDDGELLSLLDRLTRRHEAGRPTPWSIDDAPAGYIEGLLGAIVGFEVVLTQVVGKAKLSQNRSAADLAGVVAGLEGTDPDLAARVAEARPIG